MKIRTVIYVLLLVAAGCSTVPSVAPSAAVSDASADEAHKRLIAKGRSQFLHCNSCHVTDAAAPPPFGDSLGPHLEHIVGRRAASVDGFAYTEALQTLDLVWDEETLDRWLRQPQAMVPAMCEPFMGMANPESRKALIAFLKNPPN